MKRRSDDDRIQDCCGYKGAALKILRNHFNGLTYDFFYDRLTLVDHQERPYPAHRYPDFQESKLKKGDKKTVKLSRCFFPRNPCEKGGQL